MMPSLSQILLLVVVVVILFKSKDIPRLFSDTSSSLRAFLKPIGASDDDLNDAKT